MRMTFRLPRSTAIAAAAALLLMPVLGCGFVTKATSTGNCGEFLHSSTCTGTGTGTSTTLNMAFVANSGSNTVSGFSLSTAGALTALTGSPLSFTLPPTAVAVSRGNTFLWVGTVTQIFGYAISSTGALTALNGGAALTNANCADMQTTPDGKYLMVLDGSGSAIDLFAINTDGSLAVTGGGGIGFTLSGAFPHALRINAAGTVVAAALGTAGELLFSFNSSTGTLTQLGQPTPPPNLTSDFGNAWDPTGAYLYVVRTGSAAGLVVEQLGNNGVLTPTTSTVYATGSNPYAVTTDVAGKYVYVANHGDSTISAYGVGTSQVLSTVSGSPFAAGTGVAVLGAESTTNYLLAVSPGGTPDLAVYGFDASVGGKLNSVSSSATGTTASFLALSH